MFFYVVLYIHGKMYHSTKTIIKNSKEKKKTFHSKSIQKKLIAYSHSQ